MVIDQQLLKAINDALYWVREGLDNVDMSPADRLRTKQCEKVLEDYVVDVGLSRIKS